MSLIGCIGLSQSCGLWTFGLQRAGRALQQLRVQLQCMHIIYMYVTYVYVRMHYHGYILQKTGTFAWEGSSAGGKAGQAAPEGRLVGA